MSLKIVLQQTPLLKLVQLPRLFVPFGFKPTILQQNVVNVAKVQIFLTRNFKWHTLFRKKSEKEYKELLGLPNHYQLVYNNSSISTYMDGALFMIYTFFASGCVFTIGQVLGIEFFLDIAKSIEETVTESAIHISAATILLIGNCIITFYIFRAGRTLVSHIFFSEKDNRFMAIVNQSVPYRRKVLSIECGELSHRKTGKIIGVIVPWLQHLYYYKDQSQLILFADSFRLPIYFHKLVAK